MTLTEQQLARLQNQHAWIAVALRVMEGDYRKASPSVIQSLLIGLRSIDHPDCRAAVSVLKSEK